MPAIDKPILADGIPALWLSDHVLNFPEPLPLRSWLPPDDPPAYEEADAHEKRQEEDNHNFEQLPHFNLL